ncbi:MAG TPA: glycosyltransferase family 4 protein [Actinomycetota bacterium]
MRSRAASMDEDPATSRPGFERPLRLVMYHDNRALGGSEAALGVLVRHLHPGHRITIVGVDEDVVRWIGAHRPGVRTIVIRAVRDRRDVGAMAEHLRVFRALRPDILQVNLPMAWSGRYAILAGLLLRSARLIAVDHSPLPAYSRGILRYRQLTIPREAAHVAVSTALARHVERLAKLPSGRVRVIYNGVEGTGPPPVERPRQAPPVVGVVARLSREKGLDVFLRAMAELPQARSVIVGDGPERPQLEELARTLCLTDRVTWTGWRDDVRDLLPSFDVFALPSRAEGLPVTVVEAALAERPIVATEIGGIREIVVPGETGLLVPPDDAGALGRAIGNLLDDEEDARRMAGNARARALGMFDPEEMANAYEALYTEVLRGRRRRGPSGPVRGERAPRGS